MLDWAREHPRAQPLVVRLVKGAYWDHEIVEARRHGWPAPVFEDKADCDRNFEELTRRLLDARPLVRVAVASHNLRSVAHAIAYNRALGAPTTATSSSRCCAGSATTCSTRSSRTGLRVRTYCPVGDLVAGMAYLVRRLLENTSNESLPRRAGARRRARGAAGGAVKPFVERAACRAAPRAGPRGADGGARATSTPTLPLARAGADRRRARRRRGHSTRPTRRARSAWSRPPAARPRPTSPQAVEVAAQARRDWGARPRPSARPRSCGPPDVLRRRRHELAALQVRECAKPWAEADADVCEAIDFLEYYARQALELEAGRELCCRCPGERNTMRYGRAACAR